MPSTPLTPLTCKEFIDFLGEFREGSLPRLQRARFEAHLRACPDCRAYLASYARAVELGGWVCAGEEPLPEDVPADLVAAILAARVAGAHRSGADRIRADSSARQPW